MKNIIQFGFTLVLSLFILSCDSSIEPGPSKDKNGVFSIEFDNIVGDETLEFNNRTYKNAMQEPFTISMVQYFVSNIKLTNEDGTEFIVPTDSSYFLIQGADKATRFAKLTVPEGNYTKVSFVLGVDSLKNVSPVEERKGVLSSDGAGAGMYWSWNSGYIFFKMEGSSTSIPDEANNGNKQFKYHIGGFGGYSSPSFNNIKTISIDLPKANTAQVREGYRSNVHLFVDLMKIFNGSNQFSIAAYPVVMVNPYSVNIANNFKEMFTNDHTENFVKSETEL